MNEENRIRSVLKFLSQFMPVTLSKRAVCITSPAVGIPNEQIAQLTGFCDKTVKSVQKKLSGGTISELLKIGGGGRKSKATDVEQAVIDEIRTCIHDFKSFFSKIME